MRTLGFVMRAAEETFGGVWSVAEVAVMASRLDELGRDPHRNAVVEDIRQRGWYVPLTAADVDLRARGDGWILADNPYERIGHPRRDRVVAKLVPATAQMRAKHLVVVCHCYGVPSPLIMSRLFGLHGAAGVDVAYNIMNHHQWGSFPAWPGTGFVSGRLSYFIENLRSSITGVRALIAALRESRGYERVTVIGFSIGGQLALHMGNAAHVEQVIAYAPVVSLYKTAKELGLMRVLHKPVTSALARFMGEYPFDDLQLTEPLRYPLRIAQEDLHVIVQRYDALATEAQIEPIREAYPRASWDVYDGTHVVPAGIGEFQRKIKGWLA
jgi:predicted esterase